MSESIVLIGLPGSGKKRFQRAFAQTFPEARIEILSLSEPTSLAEVDFQIAQVWCVIDVRSPLTSAASESQLQALLQQATAVVLSFVAAADLSTQAFWQDWLKKQDPKKLPRKRWQGLDVAKDDSWLSLSSPDSFSSLKHYWQGLAPLQQFSITFGALSEAKRFHLEHLLMALDAAKNSLQMDLWRVQGFVLTYEYDHAVAIEMTVNRFDVFAADPEQSQSYLTVLGRNFDQAWLLQTIEASQL